MRVHVCASVGLCVMAPPFCVLHELPSVSKDKFSKTLTTAPCPTNRTKLRKPHHHTEKIVIEKFQISLLPG